VFSFYGFFAVQFIDLSLIELSADVTMQGLKSMIGVRGKGDKLEWKFYAGAAANSAFLALSGTTHRCIRS